MKIKHLLLGSLVTVTVSATVLTASAATDPDYAKIRKDLNVMTRVVKGAFQDNESCNGCEIKITSNYLAKQGATFTIGTYRSTRSYSFSSDGDTSFIINESTFDRLAPMEDIEDIEDLEALGALSGVISVPDIPDMVSSILVDVGESIGEAGANIQLFGEQDWDSDKQRSYPHIRIDRSSRLASRELNRAIRDLEYKIRDLEIELLHAEDPDESKRIEENIASIEKEVIKVRAKRGKINEKQKAKKKAYLEKKKAEQALAEQKKDKLLKQVQQIVLQSFCDYGSTLKHVPENEKVSLIFTQRKKNSDMIFILNKKDISNCSSGEKLQADALSYLF